MIVPYTKGKPNMNQQAQPSRAVALSSVVLDTWDEAKARAILSLFKTAIQSADDFTLFAVAVQRTGLDPFARQIYAILRGGKMSIEVGIDGLALQAARSKRYAGMDEAVYTEAPVDEKTGFRHPAKAVVTVYRMTGGVRCPFVGVALWDESAPYYNNKLGDMWKKRPYGQLAKCARAQALRMAFPAECSGFYTAEEMEQADDGARTLSSATVVEGSVARTATATPAIAAPVTADPVQDSQDSQDSQDDVIYYDLDDDEPAADHGPYDDNAPVSAREEAPATPVSAAPSFNPMNSATFAKALRGIGLSSVQQKEDFVARAKKNANGKPLYEACLAQYEAEKAELGRKQAALRKQAEDLHNAVNDALQATPEEVQQAERVQTPKPRSAGKRGPSAAHAPTVPAGVVVPASLEGVTLGSPAN